MVEEEITDRLDQLGRTAQRTPDAAVIEINATPAKDDIRPDLAEVWHGDAAAGG